NVLDSTRAIEGNQRNMIIVKRIFGALALLIGLAIVAWFLYNLIAPTADFRRSFRSPFQLIMPIAMIWYGWRWLSDGGPGIETIQISNDVPELVRSRAQARRTMNVFLEAVRRHVDGAFVKFPLVTDAGVTEHIWGYVHHYADGVFNVSLANTPHTQKTEVDSRR